MRESCRTFDKSRANENIVALAVRLAKEFASYNPNISFSTDKGVFNFRTAAIIVQNGKLLVTKDDSTEHYYLPGGRVTMREKAEDALTRELKEELGVTVAPERAVWIAQSFFTPTGKKQRYHELCTYFTVDASGTDLITRGDRFDSPNEPSVHFAWFPFEELPYIDLRPAFLKTEVPIIKIKNIVLNRRSYHEKTLAFSFCVLCRKPRIPRFSVAPASARIHRLLGGKRRQSARLPRHVRRNEG